MSWCAWVFSSHRPLQSRWRQPAAAQGFVPKVDWRRNAGYPARQRLTSLHVAVGGDAGRSVELTSSEAVFADQLSQESR